LAHIWAVFLIAEIIYVYLDIWQFHAKVSKMLRNIFQKEIYAFSGGRLVIK